MATVLRFIEKETGAVRLDLNDPSGWLIEHGLDTGMGDISQSFLTQEGVDGGVLARSERPHRTMVLPLRLSRQASWTAMRDLWLDLGTELNREINCLEFIPDPTDDPYYITTYRSEIPSLFRGQSLETVARRLQDIGMPVTIRRDPYSERGSTAGTPTARTNAILSRHLDVSNPGNAPGLSKLTFTPENGARFGGVRVGVRSTGNLTEFATLYGVELESGSLGVDTTSTVVAGSSGGSAARVSFSTNETLERRVRIEQTPTDDTALQGTFTNTIRLKPSAADVFRIQLRWGLSDVDPVPFTNEVIELDFSDVDTFDWVSVDLGTITVGEGSTFLVREVHVRRVSGSGTLDLDTLHLHGAEQTAIYSVPGTRHGDASKERWRGDELIQGPTVSDSPAESAGSIKENRARVNAENEVMAIPPSGGKTWVAGVHKASVDCLVFIDDASKSSATKVGELQVIANDAGAGAWQVRKKVNLKSRKNRTKINRKRSFTFTVTDADVAASTKFVIRVKQTESTASGRKIEVEELGHSFTRSVADTQKMVIDGTTNPPRMYVADSTGGFLFPLNHEGTPFLTVPPGDSVWTFEPYDLPTDPGYDDIDTRGMLLRHVLARSVTCQVDVVRRDTT